MDSCVCERENNKYKTNSGCPHHKNITIQVKNGKAEKDKIKVSDMISYEWSRQPRENPDKEHWRSINSIELLLSLTSKTKTTRISMSIVQN